MNDMTSLFRDRFDRLCDMLADSKKRDVPWQTEARRGALDLDRDGSAHRKYHSMFEDLHN